MEFLDLFYNLIVSFFRLTLFGGYGFFPLLIVCALAITLAYIVRKVIS